MNGMYGIYTGIPCRIAPQVKKQKKTSRYKIINWLYGKMYGYEYESTLPDGMDVVYVDGEIIFRDEETFNRLTEQIPVVDSCSMEVVYE